MGSASRPIKHGVRSDNHDPPYYDAIPYSDSDGFLPLWLRRVAYRTVRTNWKKRSSPQSSTRTEVGCPAGDGELIDDASRFGGDKERSKLNYEDGMARAFRSCHRRCARTGGSWSCSPTSSPEAWETLVAALIRAGFVVDGSWPIQTERQVSNRDRSAPPPLLPPSGSSARSGPPLAPAGTTRSSTKCARTSPSSSTTSGTPASAAPTSCGPPPGRPSKPSAGIPWSRRRTPRASRCPCRSSCATCGAWSWTSSSAVC